MSSGGGGVRSNGKITRSVSTTKSSLKRSCGWEGERQSMAINELLLEAKLWKGGREAINGNQWRSTAIDGDHLKRVHAINWNPS
jgi:hypothetical protein